MYTEYTRYDRSGKIVGTGTCSVEDLHIQHYPEGGGVLQGYFPADKFYVLNGSPRAFDEIQLEKMDLINKEGGSFLTWDDDFCNLVDHRSLLSLKETKLNILKGLRDITLSEGTYIEIRGQLLPIKADSESISRLTLYKSEGEGVEVSWRFKGNIWVTLRYVDICSILTSLTELTRSTFDKYKTLEDKVLAATTPEELDAITWN